MQNKAYLTRFTWTTAADLLSRRLMPLYKYTQTETRQNGAVLYNKHSSAERDYNFSHVNV